MCSYTRDPHLGPKGRPLPTPDEAMRRSSYTDNLAVTLKFLAVTETIQAGSMTVRAAVEGVGSDGTRSLSSGQTGGMGGPRWRSQK
jgi:hypothetical protein